MENTTNFIINFENVTHTDAITEYIQQKFSKPKFVNRNIVLKEVHLKKLHDSGREAFSISVSIVYHNKSLFFTSSGEELYSLIDKIESQISGRISKFDKH
jgi:ribosomal subunit interface protein